MDYHPIQGGLEIPLDASCHGNRDKLRPDGPLGSYADYKARTLSIWPRFERNYEGLKQGRKIKLV